MLKLSIIGNLGADAEIKSHNGKQFVSFRVAHSEKYVDGDGVIQERTVWVSCLLNGDGGKLTPYLQKGTKVYCHGDMNIRLYRYNGEISAGLNLNVREIELCGCKRTDGVQSGENGGQDNEPF